MAEENKEEVAPPLVGEEWALEEKICRAEEEIEGYRQRLSEVQSYDAEEVRAQETDASDEELEASKEEEARAIDEERIEEAHEDDHGGTEGVDALPPEDATNDNEGGDDTPDGEDTQGVNVR